MLAFDPKIITFYSYKGGVGRSMALANVAWLLAKTYQKKVLIVDWDLEAPGINKYFDLKDDIYQGLIDILYKFQDLAKTEGCTFEGQFLDISQYIIDIKEDFGKGSLSILPAGGTSKKYGNQVAQFDWNDFYKNSHGFGFIEYLKEQFKQKADFILVDSRTGLSDIGGICTLQLPDVVVLMFALNEQSIYGTEMIIESILNKSKRVKTNKISPQLIIIPSRVEKFMEIESKKTWEITAAQRLHKYISNKFLFNMDDLRSQSGDLIFESLPNSNKLLSGSSGQVNHSGFDEGSHSKDEKKRIAYGREYIHGQMTDNNFNEILSRSFIDYMREKSIPYVGYYSFGEKLSVKEDISEEPNKSFYKLTEMILVTSGYKFNEELEYYQYHIQTLHNNKYVRGNAAKALGTGFRDVPDKQQAWNDLLRLTNDEDSFVRSSAVSALKLAYPHYLDKQQVWNDLVKLTSDEDRYVMSSAASVLKSAFSQVPNKQQAWEDLHRLTFDENDSVRSSAASALKSAFSQVSNKQQIWEDLHRLIFDKNDSVRSSAASALKSAFSQVPDKQQAWEDLHRLTFDENDSVRSSAASAFKSVFSQVPDKQQVWEDLHRLTFDDGRSVRSSVASALKSAFSQVPDKQQAWEDLHRLANDKDSYVRSSAAKTLGSAFSQVPDKQQAWEDLHRLANDKDSYVRTSSNHSLGRISILMASQAETDENYKKELEKAIEFFEIASKEATYHNPAQFCLPFYRSFHTIIFRKHAPKEEIDKYLEEAKAAIGGSESEKQLFEAVENLAEALKEIHDLGNLDFEAKKSELKFYRKYCDHAAELMKDIEEKAPVATKVLRKGLPILDRNLKELLDEIQENAKTVCKETKGTSAEYLGLETNKAAKKLSEFQDYSTLDVALVRQIEDFKHYCGFILPGKKSQFIRIIEETKNMDIFEKLKRIKEINEYILKNALFPRIEHVFIADKKQEYVRIATVQINYTLSENFPYQIKDESKEVVKQKIRDVFVKAINEKVDILCLPELCVCEEWLPELRSLCQKMIVVAGTYYDKENHNICRLITNFNDELSPQLKIVPSDFEYSDITEQRMNPGEKVLNVYESQFGKFAVLIDRDFGNFSSHLKGIADIILCPSYNEANKRFHELAHILVTDNPSYIIISNCAQYGGTSIFGRMRKSLFGALVQSNCKEKNDLSYKLCQIERGKEGMIVADLNLIYKSEPLQAPMSPEDDIRPVRNIKKILF